MKYTRVFPALTFLALAVLALVGSGWFIAVSRFPDGALAAGLGVALGTSGVVWILVERRRILRCGSRTVAPSPSATADQRDQPFFVESGIS